jgi:hypothetical protein
MVACGVDLKLGRRDRLYAYYRQQPLYLPDAEPSLNPVGERDGIRRLFTTKRLNLGTRETEKMVADIASHFRTEGAAQIAACASPPTYAAYVIHEVGSDLIHSWPELAEQAGYGLLLQPTLDPSTVTTAAELIGYAASATEEKSELLWYDNVGPIVRRAERMQNLMVSDVALVRLQLDAWYRDWVSKLAGDELDPLGGGGPAVE